MENYLWKTCDVGKCIRRIKDLPAEFETKTKKDVIQNTNLKICVFAFHLRDNGDKYAISTK